MSADDKYPPYQTHTEAILSYAAKDPALASILVHQHDCLEETKRLASAAVRTAHETKADVQTLRGTQSTLIWTTVGTLFSSLIGTIGFLFWQIISHPKGFFP